MTNVPSGAPDVYAPIPDPSELAPEDRLRLIGDGISSYVTPLVTGWLALVLIPVMIRRLGTLSYGVWIACTAFTALVASFDLGLGSTLTREVAAGSDRRGALTEDAAAFVIAARDVYLLLGLTGATIVAVGSLVATQSILPGDPANTKLAGSVLIRLAVAFFFDQLFVFALTVMGGLGRFRLLNMLSILSVLVRNAGFLILLWFFQSSVVFLATFQALASAASGLMAVAMIQRSISPAQSLLRRSQWKVLARAHHARFAAMSQMITAAAAAIWQTPVLIIAGTLGSSATVPFHIGLRFPMFAYGLNGRATTVFFTEANRAVSDDNRDALAQTLKFATRLIVTLTTPVVIILWVVAPYLLQAWIGRVDVVTVSILRIGLLTILADSFASASLQTLWGLASLKAVLSVTVGTLIAAGVLSLLLLSRFGVRGVAAALALSISGGAVAMLIAGSRACSTRIGDVLWYAIRRLPLPAITTAIVVLAAVHGIDTRPWFRVAVASILGGLTFLSTIVAQEIRNTNSEFGFLRSFARRRLHLLRSAWYLLALLRERVRPDPWTASQFDTLYQGTDDAWSYQSSWGIDHLKKTASMLDLAKRTGPTVQNSLEIGCGDGYVTELLAARWPHVLAVDISPVALERARARCDVYDNVKYALWDLTRDSSDQHYDLILAMGMIETIRGRKALRVARQRLVDLLSDDGSLFVTIKRQNEVVESAIWDRWLLRGSTQLHRFIASHTALQVVEVFETPTHFFGLYRKRPSRDSRER